MKLLKNTLFFVYCGLLSVRGRSALTLKFCTKLQNEIMNFDQVFLIRKKWKKVDKK